MAEYQPPPQIEGNAEVVVARAERHYFSCDFLQCYKITAKVLGNDPFQHGCLVLHPSTAP